MKYILSLIIILSLSSEIEAQATLNSNSLKIGDRVSDITINNIINYRGSNGKPTTMAKISDFKNKLLILDFWATWCSSCIQNFPEVDSLQKIFAQNVQFLLVNTKSTGDKKVKIEKLLNDKSRFGGRTINIPCVILDTLLDQMFVHKMIPHYAWINNGKVVAITSATEVNGDNIRRVLQNGPLNLKVKQDLLAFDSNRPLFVDGNGGSENILFRSQISGEISGLSGVNNINRDKNGLITLYRKINTSKLQLYKLAYNATVISNNRIFIGDDTTNVIQRKLEDPYVFCYELICPSISLTHVKKRLQFDLEQYFNLRGKIETKVLQCLIIKKDSSKNFIDTSSSSDLKVIRELKPFQTISLSDLTAQLNAVSPFPILDESNYSTPIKMVLPEKFTDLTHIEDELHKQGFILKTENRAVEVFILSPPVPESLRGK